jgi:hypothetical protein
VNNALLCIAAAVSQKPHYSSVHFGCQTAASCEDEEEEEEKEGKNGGERERRRK